SDTCVNRCGRPELVAGSAASSCLIGISRHAWSAFRAVRRWIRYPNACALTRRVASSLVTAMERCNELGASSFDEGSRAVVALGHRRAGRALVGLQLKTSHIAGITRGDARNSTKLLRFRCSRTSCTLRPVFANSAHLQGLTASVGQEVESRGLPGVKVKS